MVQCALVYLAVGWVAPANRLCLHVQVDSAVHCHLRLLPEPMPYGRGRVYQRSPQEARASWHQLERRSTRELERRSAGELERWLEQGSTG